MIKLGTYPYCRTRFCFLQSVSICFKFELVCVSELLGDGVGVPDTYFQPDFSPLFVNPGQSALKRVQERVVRSSL